MRTHAQTHALPPPYTHARAHTAAQDVDEGMLKTFAAQGVGPLQIRKLRKLTQTVSAARAMLMLMEVQRPK